MKLSQIMGISLDGDYYHYGDKLIKLYHDDLTREKIEEIFQNQKNISEVLPEAARVIELKVVDDHLGIVIETIEGKSMLSKLEEQPNDIMDFAEKFADIQKKINGIQIKSIPDQMTYFSEQLKKASIDNQIKLELLDFLNGERHYQQLCHGMFQPDKIVCTDDHYTIIDFERAYSGNPVSDVAMTQIILESPRIPKAASDFLKDQIRYSRQVFKTVYGAEYIIDQESYDKYRQLAAIVRYNDHIEEEKAWLMSIINGS